MSTKRKVLLIGGAIVVILILLILKNRADVNSGPTTGSFANSFSVTVVKAAMRTIDERVTVVTSLSAFNDVTVLSETQGRVVKVYAEVGDYKPAGSVLVEVDSELKQAAFKAAQVTYEKAKKDLDRYEALYSEHSIPETQIEQARWSAQTAESQFIVARRQLNDTKITTPISGIVTARFVNVGTMVMGAPQATQIANVVDLSRLKARASVAEKDVMKLHAGDPADATTDIYPQTIFPGSVFTISSKADEAHTYLVEVVLNNPRQLLKAGMFASVTIRPRASKPVLLIPRAALVGSVQDARVYVVNGDTARLRPVIAGRSFGTDIEVSGGLKEGESVVVDGQDNLSDNVRVVVRNQ